MLNSATVTPRIANSGANMAAGYTTDDVPTWKENTLYTYALEAKL